MSNRLFFKDVNVVALSPLQISEGLADGLQELTPEEIEAHLNPPIDIPKLLGFVKTQMRTTRAHMLDALTGIAGRESRTAACRRQEQAQALAQDNVQLAQEFGEQAAVAENLVVEADSLAVALLDITDDPALNAAQTLQDMQAAGVAAYRAIAATASAELAVVFKEITGA